MKTILFDFGGTIDTNGIHWFEKYREIYLDNGLNINTDNLKEAYIHSERMAAERIKPTDDFITTYQKKITYQLEYLNGKNVLDHIKDINETAFLFAINCYSDVKNNIGKVIPLLDKLKKEYTIGIVSNYYGNLPLICKDFKIDHYFKAIVDSTNVGINKPDAGIYLLALKELNASAKSAYMVGDSYDKDILPTKELGLTTIFLKGKGWSEPEDTSKADWIINSIFEIEKIMLTNAGAKNN